MNPIPEEHIRKLAHQIWESEGRPHGQHERHWQMACALASAVTNVAHSGEIASRRITLPGAVTHAQPGAQRGTPMSR